MAMKWERHSAAVIRSARWKGVRLQAKRRDGWKCVQCSARGRLEVDHIKPVRTHPELSYDLTNLQTLCPSCHSRKTRIEVGMGERNPRREAWGEAVAAMMPAAKRGKHTGDRNA
ncbi:HNH endonuclease [Paracoccus sp. YIM 132242]|uniref:Putative HNH nuclease YajD n=1 Tax=Paracoccus lichenicola TaxID=2665644 RepID=A0A6L6HNS1_9RHOB|nr:HNH endonuclease signature motif containing protein [Paracoccus lichenicola]MTD99930.1 HNH endonuclease [Paracoccus lichenicola]